MIEGPLFRTDQTQASGTLSDPCYYFAILVRYAEKVGWKEYVVIRKRWFP